MNMTEGHAPDLSSTITPPTRPARRRGPWRWLVAGLATLLLVVSGSGLIAFAQTGAGEGRGPAFVPADAPIYLEARIDMPDGQDAALAELLTAFPGFADSASFQLRIDEALDAAVSDATDGELTFSEDISPWITGEIGLALMDLGAAMASDADTPPMLVGVGVSDAAAASAFVDTLVAESGMTLTEEDHGGFGVISADDAAIAVTDDFLLIGTAADLVKQGIDALGGAEPSLAEDEGFQTAFARVPAGHLGAVYADLSAFGDLITAAMAMSPQPGPEQMTDQLLSQLPEDLVAYVAAAPNGVTIEAFITPGEGTPALAMGESDLALDFPSDTQLYVEVRDLGSTVQTTIESFMTQMSAMGGMDPTEQLEPIEGLLGVPLPQVLDFVEDAAIGGAVTSDGVWLGIAGEVNDVTVAGERLERILGLVGMMAAGEDSEVSITESEVDGTTVTTITLPPDVEMGSMPIGDSVSVAVSDAGLLLLGTGDFVTEALTTDGTDSLGTSEGYTSALGEATANAGVVYADIAGLLTTLDPLLSFMVDDWDEISPWIGGLDRFVAVSTAGDEVISARVTLFVD